MSTCTTILTGNLDADCNFIPVAGVTPQIILINLADWKAAIKVYDINNPLILRSIVLPAGTKGYTFTVFKKTHKPSFTNKDGTYSTQYLHEIVTAIQIWNNDIKNQISALSGNYYVAIVENLQTTGDAIFEVYGAVSGLRIQDGAKRDLGANDGVYVCTLGNDSDSYEPKPPLTFAVNDNSAPPLYSYTLTQAAVNQLKTNLLPATITTQPSGQGLTVGQTINMTVVATNATTYQWYKFNTGTSGASTALTGNGATTATYNKANAQTTDAGTYFVKVTGGDGSILTSANATINVS